MINIEVVDYVSFLAFWLCFTRWLAIMFQLPIFDNVAIPAVVKVLACLFLTYTFFPYVSAEIIRDIEYIGMEHFWVLTIFNVVVGLILGFFVKSIMSTFLAAGEVISQHIGFMAVRYFDPQAGQQVGPFEQILNWTVLIMIVMSGALIPMFRGVVESFYTIHIYDFGKLAMAPEFYFNLFKSTFVSALLLASPIIFTNILVMSVLGIIARLIPQMNVLMVSFVINIGLGLLVFSASSGEFFQVAYQIYVDRLGEWFLYTT